MSEKYKFHDPDGIYFITITVVKWIPIFDNETCINIILESLKFCQKEKGLIIHCWCIMPSHLHLIVSRRNAQISLSEIIRDFKKFTSRSLIALVQSKDQIKGFLPIFKDEASGIRRNTKYKVWTDGSHPILLDTNFLIDQKVEYVHNNPLVANLCRSPEEYKWSSAIDYYTNNKGLLDLEFIN